MHFLHCCQELYRVMNTISYKPIVKHAANSATVNNFMLTHYKRCDCSLSYWLTSFIKEKEINRTKRNIHISRVINRHNKFSACLSVSNYEIPNIYINEEAVLQSNSFLFISSMFNGHLYHLVIGFGLIFTLLWYTTVN